MNELSDLERLEKLLAVRPACVRIVTTEEDEARALVVNAGAGAMRRPDGYESLVSWTAVRGVHDVLLGGSDSVAGTENAAGALVHLAATSASKLVLLLDLVPHLQDPRTLRAWRELVQACAKGGGTVVMIDSADGAPPVVAGECERFELSYPGEAELESIVRSTLQRMNRDIPVKAEITRSEFRTVIRNLRGLTRRQARRVISDVVAEDRTFSIYDLNSIMAHKRRVLEGGGLLEYVKAPVDLDAIGGMKNLKRWLRVRADAEVDDARGFGIEPSRGVLILGVQGAGKSLCAKAIATAW